MKIFGRKHGEPGGPVPPEVAAWGLVSKKGWVWADQEYLGGLKWVPCPPFFPDGEDRKSWAAESAELWFSSGPYSRKEAGRLAAMLAGIHQDLYAAGHCHQAFIHLPDPRMIPLPVQVGVWAMDGERDQALRMLSNADDPAAVEPPTVEEFTTERLGTGLKVQRRRPGALGPGTDVYLDYAWRSEQYETDLRMFTFWTDTGRIAAARDDLDDLARALDIVPRRW